MSVHTSGTVCDNNSVLLHHIGYRMRLMCEKAREIGKKEA